MGDLREQLCFARSINYFAKHLAGHDAVYNLESVGIDIIDPELRLQTFAHILKSAREDRGFVAEVLQRPDQPMGAIVEPHASVPPPRVLTRGDRPATRPVARKLSWKFSSPRIARSVISAT